MAALLFTFLAVLAVGLGARDQLTLAAMTHRQGARPGLLLIAAASGLATVALAAWASQIVAAALPAPARLLFAAIALGFAGLEMLVLRRASQPLEPTHSLGALALVLLAQQLTDAARFVVLAIAVATLAPLTVGLGGGAAALVLAAVGWLAADSLADLNLVRPRRLLGGALVLVAIWLALRALGLA